MIFTFIRRLEAEAWIHCRWALLVLSILCTLRRLLVDFRRQNLASKVDLPERFNLSTENVVPERQGPDWTFVILDYLTLSIRNSRLVVDEDDFNNGSQIWRKCHGPLSF